VDHRTTMVENLILSPSTPVMIGDSGF